MIRLVVTEGGIVATLDDIELKPFGVFRWRPEKELGEHARRYRKHSMKGYLSEDALKQGSLCLITGGL